MGKAVGDHRKATGSQITSGHNQSSEERTTPPTLKSVTPITALQMPNRYLVHLLLQTAVGDVGAHRGAVMAVPLSVFSEGHRARIRRVDPRPTATEHGLVQFI